MSYVDAAIRRCKEEALEESFPPELKALKFQFLYLQTLAGNAEHEYYDAREKYLEEHPDVR